MDEANLEETLQKGIRAARRGHKEPAQRLLTQVVKEDPQNEQAWMWLARVVDSPDVKGQCLQQVLKLNPDNRWAADQLAALEAQPQEQPPAPAEPAKPAEAKLETELLKCPHCGGSVNLRGGSEIQTVVCNYCGSVLELSQEQAAIVGQADRSVKPFVPIELGMEGEFEEQKYQVIGWLRYEGWDSEETWQWDEWLLVSEAGQFRWLSYDPETREFILYKKIAPLEPFDPRRANQFKVPGGVARVTERSPARVVALAGELTWRGKVGDRLSYLDARRGSTYYSVEYSTDELEMSEGHRLPAAKVWQAFGQEEKAAQAAKQMAAHQAGKFFSDSTQFSKTIIIIIILVIVLVFFCPLCSCGARSLGGPSVRVGSPSGPSVGGGSGFGK